MDDVGEHRLREWVREDFAVELTALDRVRHGADVDAAVWHGVSGDARYAVKRSGGGTPAGLLVPAGLAARGVPGVVAPVPTRLGKPWSERRGRRLSLVPWVSDVGALNGGMTARQWTRYGALLASAHATAPSGPMVEALPRTAYTAHRRWVSEVRALDSRLRAGVPADPLARAAAEEWRAAAGLVSALVERAGELGRELRAKPAADVLCHGDPHLGNVLVHRDGQVWLIDWDDAVLAPRELDLMFVIGGVLAFAPVGPRERSWFFDGYGPVDVDPARLAYFRCTRALEDLVVPAAHAVLSVPSVPSAQDGGCPEHERAEALALFRGVLSPTGLASYAV
ncbi:aminoglycoside phosphotransferase family protein [Amycolatopsis nigrescens]|uniref:aminoglycoside phosphotransferase family protein n=1 Tax=Amycolatopsis nigrescens TaxID=381445 RepID=UPI00035CE365|nr:aminoglycoside phosphotransferase family protein [Amycolatopsis nigrescens]